MKKGFITRRVVPLLFAVSVLGRFFSPSSEAKELLALTTTLTQAKSSHGTTKIQSTAPSNLTKATSGSATVALSINPNTRAQTTKTPNTFLSTTTTPVTTNQAVTTTPAITTPTTTTIPIVSDLVVESIVHKDTGQIKVHFINVGQADSIFIELPNNETMLIDAGTSSSSSGIVKYIENKTSKLTYAVATHPHADHIGGMAKVINSIAIDRFIMPRKQHTTATFEGMLDALIKNKVKVTEAKAGQSILDTKDLDIDILGPQSSASGSNLNNYSAIIRIRYKEVNFLFIGDAESSALTGLSPMNMDVLKVGHHGSDSSSSLSFLKKVDPEYSVISVGSNSYGHPTQSTLANLNSAGSNVYRTDQSGTIIITSDGKKIEVNKSPAKAVTSVLTPVKVTPSTKPTSTKPSSTKPTSTKPPTTKPPTIVTNPTHSQTVYGTATGAKYHTSGCRYLAKSKIPMTLSEAKASGLTACSVCH